MSAISLVAADVHYFGGSARAALVASADPRFETITQEWVRLFDQEQGFELTDYEPGQFYRRELPVLEAVLAESSTELSVGLLHGPLVLIVDGYVDLEPDRGHPGLGRHAHETFGCPVIGVAKTPFRTATHAARVVRGRSRNPLYVTAAGLPQDEAADLVLGMAGSYRIPDALKRVDQLARGLIQPVIRPAQ